MVPTRPALGHIFKFEYSSQPHTSNAKLRVTKNFKTIFFSLEKASLFESFACVFDESSLKKSTQFNSIMFYFKNYYVTKTFLYEFWKVSSLNQSIQFTSNITQKMILVQCLCLKICILLSMLKMRHVIFSGTSVLLPMPTPMSQFWCHGVDHYIKVEAVINSFLRC